MTQYCTALVVGEFLYSIKMQTPSTALTRLSGIGHLDAIKEFPNYKGRAVLCHTLSSEARLLFSAGMIKEVKKEL
jgi:hypothetical protein